MTSPTSVRAIGDNDARLLPGVARTDSFRDTFGLKIEKTLML